MFRKTFVHRRPRSLLLSLGVPSRPSPGSYPGPVQVPSRVEGVPSRFAMCFVLQYFGPIQVPRWGPSRPVLGPSCSRAFLPGSGLDGPKQTSWPLPIIHRSLGDGVRKNGVYNRVRIDDVGRYCNSVSALLSERISAGFCNFVWSPESILNFRIGSVSSIGGLIAAILFAAAFSDSQSSDELFYILGGFFVLGRKQQR